MALREVRKNIWHYEGLTLIFVTLREFIKKESKIDDFVKECCL
jgi:hypothetical protein